MSKQQIVVLGDAVVDMVIQLPDRSIRPLDLSRSVPQLHGGGTAANTAVTLARLGVPVSFIGSVGDDGYARWLARDLAHQGVAAHGLQQLPDVFTPMVLAMVEPDGERMLVVWPDQGGADKHLRVEHLDTEMITGAAWLHTTGMCLRVSPVRETVLHAMQLARDAGVTVSIDLNLRIEVWGWNDALRTTVEKAVTLADVVFGSGREEIMPVAGAPSVEEAARALADGKRTIVARLGADGAFAVTADESFQAPAFKATAVNTVGAGDAFSGGFIAARMAERDVAEALRWGNAVAALKVQREEPRDLPTRAEVAALLA